MNRDKCMNRDNEPRPASLEYTPTDQMTGSSIVTAANEASQRIADHAVVTPVYESPRLSTGLATVWIKDESCQPSHAFKDRGALNAVTFHAMNGVELVVAGSAGNHGKGLARAARLNMIDALVVVGESSTQEKRDSITAFGAEIMVKGRTFDEALEYARSACRARNGRFVHPFADSLVIAGQATIGLELLHQSLDMTHLVLPVGGGGLLAGVASVVKQTRPEVRVVAAQAAGCDAFVHSLNTGRPVYGRDVDSRFEGTAVGTIDDLTFEIGRRVVDETMLVEPIKVDKAIYDLLAETGTLLERAGGVGPAAARQLADRLASTDAQIVTIASGANPPSAMAGYIDSKARRLGWT